MDGFLQGVCCLPTFLVIWSSSTFIVPYIIALFRGDVDVIFPYISDTGAVPPESCIFGLMATITAFAGFATVYTRYKFVERLTEEVSGENSRLNKAALGIGLLSCLGMCIVATFQETVMRAIHDLGAILFFACGVGYTTLQTIISFKAGPYGAPRGTCLARALISSVALLTVIPTIICASLLKTTKLHWSSDDEGYSLHLCSAICEWIVGFSFVFFFLTYIKEFQQFSLKVRAELTACS